MIRKPVRAADGRVVMTLSFKGKPNFADICGALKLFVKVAGIRSDAF
jgi:hypothetical protein